MAKSNIRRVPFILNVDDPTDAAIWEALEPLLTRRRASAFIRRSLAQTLGIAGSFTPPELRALPAGPTARTKRQAPVMPQLPAGDYSSDRDEDALLAATDNFLNAFG